jgi:hypothetical protein
MNKKISLEKFVRIVVIGVYVIIGLWYGRVTYNELVDMEHFLDVAHGRLLIEMQRKQDVLAGCRKAVTLYTTMEGKLQNHLIELHRLTKTHGPKSQGVKSEEMEIVKLVRELDLLVEKYPGLKSKGPYVLLMETMQETGYKVIEERLNYNNWTYNYNVTCHLFPHRIVALVFGFPDRPFLTGPLDYGFVKEG